MMSIIAPRVILRFVLTSLSHKPRGGPLRTPQNHRRERFLHALRALICNSVLDGVGMEPKRRCVGVRVGVGGSTRAFSPCQFQFRRKGPHTP